MIRNVAKPAILAASLALLFAPLNQPPAWSQEATLSGWFHIIWGDPLRGTRITIPPRYVLVDEHGRATQIHVNEELLRSLGGPLALNRKYVRVAGRRVNLPQPGVEARSIQLEQSPAPVRESPALTGPQRWVTILCRFADSPMVTPHPKEWYETLMGAAYPGMDHFWREVSYNTINLVGSVVVGWYDLPQPKSYYDPPGGFVDQEKAAQDCTGVADADVYFPDYAGVNLMFNQSFNCNCALGGSWTVIRDDQTLRVGMTWMPPSDSQYLMAHEMGHGFGLPHSSGPYTATYDSRWDVMSGGNLFSELGVHAISFHKDRLEWIPAARKFVPQAGTTTTISLERLGVPAATSNYLMAQIPIAFTVTEFYTIEARRFSGYDAQVPGDAIVIHKVDRLRRILDRFAQVVDADNNGDPNDDGAMWTAGETFQDPDVGLTVTVTGASATSFQVTITYSPPVTLYTLTVTKAGTGTGTVTSDPAGINCGPTCAASFNSGANVVLAAAPDGGSGFTGWSACAGMGNCSVVMDNNKTVTATFSLPTFSDVPPSDWGFGWIHQIFQRGVTAGCGTNPLRYCPDNNVSRREMAVFIVRSMGQTQANCTGTFADVPASDWGCGWIERIAQLGITAGCATNPARYCPDDPVTRAQMAVFLNRAVNQTRCDTCGPTFDDVPSTHWAYGWIERLFLRGITAGCAGNPLRYCPDNNVTRREMAVFLIRNFFP